MGNQSAADERRNKGLLKSKEIIEY